MDTFYCTYHIFDSKRIVEDVTRAIDIFGFENGDHICLIHPYYQSEFQDVHMDARSKRTWPNGMRMSDYRYPNVRFGTASYLFQVWTHLKEMGWKVARMRIARIRPGRCYSLHNDEEIRLHLAAITNPKSFFMIHSASRDSMNMPVYPTMEMEQPEMKVFQVPADGCVYAVDTNHVHTALNGGDTDRIHVVIETVSELNDRPVKHV